ncbi:phosphatase PAP2 family protein [Salinimicrobium flavum]|uniref:Phosphatase PAP2 family protein n=1 Tax=Salinimicrobium flavum TaxID=1737065 RepID=A0ABW5J0J7_9FLAO
MEQLVEIDQELFLFLNNLGSTPWDNFWNFVTDKLTSIPFYALLLYLIYRSFGIKKTMVTLVFVALLITFTDQLANIFKHGFERPRPCRQEGVMEYARYIAVRCGRYGYFSAHAASSAALTVFLGFILRPYWRGIFLVLVFWAILVSYSRIYVGVHYPGDIITGWFFGILLGLLFYKLWKYILKRYFSIPSPEEGKTS